MNRQECIYNKLKESYNPEHLDVVNESEQHKGHAGYGETGESHFYVYIVSEAFEGKTRIECHRMINEVLKEEFEKGLHALRISAKSKI